MRSLTALRAFAAEIECARMLSLSAFFLVPGNHIRLWEVGAGGDAESEEAKVRIATGRFGVKD